MGKLKSIICSENFSTESLIVASLKDKLQIVWKGTLVQYQNLTKIDGGKSEAFAEWICQPGYH